MQGMISPPHLATTLLFDMSYWWSHCLNRCVAALVEVPGASVPFSFKPILVKLEGGGYIGPILPDSLTDLVVGRRTADRSAPKSGGDSGGSRNNKPSPKVEATGVSARVKVRYDAHLTSLYLQGG